MRLTFDHGNQNSHIIDLSLDEVASKSPLPPIIVTPCSPSSSRDFSFAFLPSPPPTSFSERLKSCKKTYIPDLRVRFIFCLFVVLFVLVCHLFAHRLAVLHPRLAALETTEVHYYQPLLSWSSMFSETGKVHESNPEGLLALAMAQGLS